MFGIRMMGNVHTYAKHDNKELPGGRQMQITNGNLLQQTGSLPDLEGRKLNVADCLNQTVTVTLDADSVRFGGASQDTYESGAVPDDYSQLGIYNRHGQAKVSETVSLTFVKTLSLNYSELTIEKDGQEQTIPLDADGGAWAVMTDGTLRRVRVYVEQEQPPCPPHRPDRPHHPGRPHDGHGPERPDGSFHLEVRQKLSKMAMRRFRRRGPIER